MISAYPFTYDVVSISFKFKNGVFFSKVTDTPFLNLKILYMPSYVEGHADLIYYTRIKFLRLLKIPRKLYRQLLIKNFVLDASEFFNAHIWIQDALKHTITSQT